MFLPPSGDMVDYVHDYGYGKESIGGGDKMKQFYAVINWETSNEFIGVFDNKKQRDNFCASNNAKPLTLTEAKQTSLSHRRYSGLYPDNQKVHWQHIQD